MPRVIVKPPEKVLSVLVSVSTVVFELKLTFRLNGRPAVSCMFPPKVVETSCAPPRINELALLRVWMVPCEYVEGNDGMPEGATVEINAALMLPCTIRTG